MVAITMIQLFTNLRQEVSAMGSMNFEDAATSIGKNASRLKARIVLGFEEVASEILLIRKPIYNIKENMSHVL